MTSSFRQKDRINAYETALEAERITVKLEDQEVRI